MNIKVRVFLGNNRIADSDMHKININNPAIDRIVNDIADKNEVSLAAAQTKVS